jgi:hypothetical protein
MPRDDDPFIGVDTGGPVASPVAPAFSGGLVDLARQYIPGAATVIEGVNAFFGGQTGGYQAPAGYQTTPTSLAGYAALETMGGGGGGGGWRAGSAASVRSVIPRFLEGAAIAASVYAAYRELRARGMGHAAAKRLAHRMHGVFHKRRRMKVSNPRALRRAMHRIKGARKMFSHVRGLMGVHHHRMGGGGGWHRGRPRRHGDLYDNVSAEADTVQDLLDDGYTPEEIEAFFGGIG